MAISKKIRFEVFKRDKFTCQYCGRKAPEVVLQADHIEPKSKGGADGVLNLITACQGCNAGKSDRRLSDDSIVTQQHAQLAELQERQEQIQMMLDWQRGLVNLDAQSVEQAADFWCELVDWYGMKESGKLTLRKVIRRHGLGAVLDAMRAAVESYVRLDDDGNVTTESAELAFKKLGGICRVRAAEADQPHLRDVFYVRGILKNRLAYVNPSQAKKLLEDAFSFGADAEVLEEELARVARNWTDWQRLMGEYLEDLGESEADDA